MNHTYESRIRAGIIDFLGTACVSFILADSVLGRGSIKPLLVLGILVLVNIVYHAIMELMWRRSFGKMAYNLTVVQADGSAPTTLQILVRNILRAVDILPNAYILAFIVIRGSPNGSQRLGDLVARTEVKKVSDREPRLAH